MAEKDTIFSGKFKYGGFFDFKEFYKFCHDWLVEELRLDLYELKYVEKLKEGNKKDIEVKWEADRKITDYFKFFFEVNFRILQLKEVEINQGGTKIKTNEGSVEVKTKGILIRDFDGKFERTAFRKFLRAIYEKWIISPRINEMEGKLFEECDEFSNQAKAWLDLSGQRV